MSILGSAWVLFTRVFFFLDHHHARRRQWRWARYVFLMIHCWLLTMTAQHRMTKAYPLACNCKPGWVSTFFLPTWTHPLACNCETGWVFFLLFCRSTNDDDDDEPCRLAIVICLCLHPRQRRQPTPSLAIARRGGFLLSFFLSQRTPTCLRLHDDDEPCRLVVVICGLPPSALTVVALFSCTPSLANASGGCYINILFN